MSPMCQLVLGNQLTLRRCQVSDIGVGRLYQELISTVSVTPTAGDYAHRLKTSEVLMPPKAKLLLTTYSVEMLRGSLTM